MRARPQGALRQADDSVLWRIWAPKATQVTLLIWDGGKESAVTMQAEADGYYVHTAANVADGLCYAYRLDDDPLELPDPASRWQPDGVHQPSAVFSPERFTWTDRHWRGVRQADLAIYELHVGTFTPEGTFEAIIPRLAELADLGITAIELMPIAQFPGARNWGYDGVHPFAAQNTYGGPRGLQQLVDAAHAAGLGVLLDVVYNHLGPEGNYFARFGHYFTTHYHTPWGAALNYDGPHSDPVRALMIQNACQWIRDFHLDGLRLDAVQTIMDESAWHLLAELQDAVQREARAAERSVVVIGETNQNDRRLVDRVEQGGYALDGVWSDDLHHAIHAHLTGERDGYYVDFERPATIAKAFNDGFVSDGGYARYYHRRHGAPLGDVPRERLVVCLQNHDQVGNRAAGDRFATLVAPEAVRLAAALVLLSPGTPLLFMGEEYGERAPFAFFCSFLDAGLNDAVRAGRQREYQELDFRWEAEVPDPVAESTFRAAQLGWSWPTGSSAAGLRALYRTLLHARRDWPALGDRQNTHATFANDGNELLVITRGGANGAIIWVNLTDCALTKLPAPPTRHRLQLSTAERRFGGERDDLSTIDTLGAYELLIWLVDK
ncbi:MAG: malto-oligosyltrehalose trehalohydrolase [Planctomycetes bacterium]|nr:malto-oligosyltrehalose trehalohydrolase [Planctomycetota bacterium]